MEKLPIKLLYVEDEEYIRIPMAEMLSRRIDEVRSAPNGIEALKLAESFHAEILVTDIKMPGINGLELITQIRPIVPEIRTIILSAHNESDFFLEAIKLGVDGFHLKPVNRQNLLTTIEKIAQETIQRKIATTNEIKFRALTSAANDAIIMLDNKLLISFCNQAAERVLGYTIDTLNGKNINSIFPDFNEKILERQLGGEVETTECVPVELTALKSNGTRIFCEASYSQINALDKRATFLIVRDISERKRREEELILAKEKAEAATEAKQQFLSVMSHEIRTPLYGIIGTVHLLMQEDPRADQLDYLKTLEFSGNQLMSIVNDILDFSKIEATGIQFESIEFNLRDLISGLMKIFSFKAIDKGIELSITYDAELPDIVIGDSMRLNQILTNLVGNALKFTERGHIGICVEKIQNKPKNTLLFKISDSGIGIPQNKLESIFEFFTQADANISRKFGGTGLGLAITKKLVELQGGALTVESEVGTGSTFSFHLPFGVADVQQHKTIVKGTGRKQFSLNGIHVLLVEDNKINQMIAKKFLDRWECTTEIASDGFEALRMIGSKKYNIVLMDLQMPELDGYETTRRIRKMEDDYFKQIPIVALTASAFNEVKEGVMAAGMTDILNKPFIPDELNQKIYYYTEQ